MNTYEVMILLDPAFASDEQNVRKEVDRLLERAGAEIIAMHRWDERKLAYEIKKRKRGVYLLIYMRAPGSSIASFERDMHLSEGILRALVLRADYLTQEKMLNPPPPPGEATRRGGEWGEGRGRREGGPRGRYDRRGPEDQPPRRRADAEPEPQPAEVGAESDA